jgi:hypothetical protein
MCSELEGPLRQRKPIAGNRARSFEQWWAWYVVNSDTAGELLPAIKAVLAGKRFVSASLAGHFLVATALTNVQRVCLSWMLTLISGMH